MLPVRPAPARPHPQGSWCPVSPDCQHHGLEPSFQPRSTNQSLIASGKKKRVSGKSFNGIRPDDKNAKRPFSVIGTGAFCGFLLVVAGACNHLDLLTAVVAVSVSRRSQICDAEPAIQVCQSIAG
jgi:hypothetical protein